MQTVQVELEVLGKTLHAEVEFTFTAGYPPKLYGLPENCYEGQPDEWEFDSLMLQDNKGDYCVDISELVDYIRDELIEQIINTVED